MSGKRQRTQKQMPAIFWVLALALAAGVIGTAVYQTMRPATFQYRDRVLEAIRGVPVNRYIPEGFHMDESGRVTYQQAGLSAKEGIDVSYHQGQIDWPAVAADGIEFAIIRLGYRGYTEGALKMDVRFEENLRGALDAGLEVGVYFFSQALTPGEAEEEARFVLDALGGQELTYPVTFDWEPITPGKEARTDGMDGQTLTQCAAAFCETIRDGGYEPAVYFNQDMGYLTFDLGQLAHIPFWLAEYDSAPDFYYHFDLWQYTHEGAVNGIRGRVDRNLDFSMFA